jgi:DNA sulfur modification protein DndE
MVDKEGDNPVELTWRTFGGDLSDVFAAAHLVRFEADKKNGDASEIGENFRRHLYRGLNYLDARLEMVDGQDLIASLLGKARLN